MILVLRPNCSDADVQSVIDRLRELGAIGRVMKSADRTLVAVENGVRIEPDAFNADPFVGDPHVDLNILDNDFYDMVARFTNTFAVVLPG